MTTHYGTLGKDSHTNMCWEMYTEGTGGGLYDWDPNMNNFVTISLHIN